MKSYSTSIVSECHVGNTSFTSLVDVAFYGTSDDDHFILDRITKGSQLLWDKDMDMNDIYHAVILNIEAEEFHPLWKFDENIVFSISELEKIIREDVALSNPSKRTLDRDDYLEHPLSSTINRLAKEVLSDDPEKKKSEINTLMFEIKRRTGVITHDYLRESVRK